MTGSEDHSGQGAAPAPGTGPVVLGIVGTALAVGMTVVLGGAAVLTWPGSAPVQVESALVSACLTLATVVAGWIATVLAAASFEVAMAPHRDRASSGPPSTPVRLVSATLISLGGALATPVLADAAEPPVAVSVAGPPAALSPSAGAAGENTDRTGADPAVPRPGWTPTREASSREPTGAVHLVNPSSRVSDSPPDHVVVHRGDTLWDIAAAHLGQDATLADVAQEWPRWYAANRDLIGPDPDLILPGQELRIPAMDGARP